MIAGSVIAHTALLAILLRAPSTVHTPNVGPMTVSLVGGRALAAARAAAPAATHRVKRMPPPRHNDGTPSLIDISLAQPDPNLREPLTDPVAHSVAAAADSAPGRVCQIGAWLQSALQADAQVQAALLTIPRPARSVSNALMLWESGWVDAPGPAAYGVSALRTAIVSGLLAAPEACRDEVIRGPELMMLTAGSDTTVIVVGSGEWRWRDLLPAAVDFGFAGASR